MHLKERTQTSNSPAPPPPWPFFFFYKLHLSVWFFQALWPSQPSWTSVTATHATPESWSSTLCCSTREGATTATQASSAAPWRASITSPCMRLCTAVGSVPYTKTERRSCLCITPHCLRNAARWPASAAWSSCPARTRCGWRCGGLTGMTSLPQRTTTPSSPEPVWADDSAVGLLLTGRPLEFVRLPFLWSVLCLMRCFKWSGSQQTSVGQECVLCGTVTGNKRQNPAVFVGFLHSNVGFDPLQSCEIRQMCPMILSIIFQCVKLEKCPFMLKKKGGKITKIDVIQFFFASVRVRSGFFFVISTRQKSQDHKIKVWMLNVKKL